MGQVLVRDLDGEAIARLKARAKRNGRSLQTELKDILERASRHNAIEAGRLADRIRRDLQGRHHSDSVGMIAEDRSR
jgi:plasmid stability protein